MIYLAADTRFLWENLQDTITGQYLTDAVISGTLKELNGDAITTFSFSNVQGTANYLGTIPASVTGTLTEDQEYIVEITATHSAGTDFRRETHTCVYRGFENGN